MAKKTSTTSKAVARRIQAHADKSGSNQGFKARAQRAGAKNAGSANGTTSSGSSKGTKQG